MINKDLALFCYPWDVIDEGYDAIINAVKRSGLNSIYITVNYHSGMFFLPHSCLLYTSPSPRDRG